MRKWHPKILLAVVCLLCGTALPSPVEKVFYHRPAFNFLESNVSEATALTEWVSDIAAAGLQLASPKQVFAQGPAGRDKRLADLEIRRIEDERFYRICVAAVALVVFLFLIKESVRRYRRWKRKKAHKAKKEARQYGIKERESSGP